MSTHGGRLISRLPGQYQGPKTGQKRARLRTQTAALATYIGAEAMEGKDLSASGSLQNPRPPGNKPERAITGIWKCREQGFLR